MNLITEETTGINKTFLKTKINKATMAGDLTFSTRDFSRGSDFICRDKVVNSNSSVHVI